MCVCVYIHRQIKHHCQNPLHLKVSSLNPIKNLHFVRIKSIFNKMASEQSNPVEPQPSFAKYSKRVLLTTILDRPDIGVSLLGQRVVVGGRVKSSREFRKEPPVVAAAPPSQLAHVVEGKDFSCVEILQNRFPFFRSILKVLGGEQRVHDKLDAIMPPRPPQPSISILEITDGSGFSSLQVLVDSSLASPSHVMPRGTCILAEGILQKPSLQGKQTVELKADKILHIGTVDQDTYPLSKMRLPLESLRDFAHFRPRSTTVASVMRIRNALTKATYGFCLENGFLEVQVPIITSTDCEGLGETFQVTTLLGRENALGNLSEWVNIETIKASIEEKSRQVEELKRSASNKEALIAAIQDLHKTTELVSQLEAKKRGKAIETSRISFSEDFFCCQTYLTGNGRMHLESYAQALGNVYSFGPRFHAKKSDSKRFLAEMWTVDLEMSFSHLDDSMECAKDFLKFACKWMLENCMEDLKFLSKRIDKHIVDRLQLVATSPFEKISYTEAVEVLKSASGRKFEARFEWGVPLKEEHESYLTDEVYKKPVIVYDHPKELKPFNVRLNDDGRTTAAFDVILPKVGTLIRGSQNEERLDILTARINESGLENQHYEWYLDLRKHGPAKSSGFSFLFDPLVLCATGLNDVRDAVPFPRSYGKANL